MASMCHALATETAAPPIQVLISVPDQRLAVVVNGELLGRYPVSTSRFGTGDRFGSYKTPLGQLRVYDKIGEDLTPGAVIRHRSPTGEVLPVNAPGRDPIVTRVIWLDGLEAQNKNALSRGIYIHGTPEEKTIGTPVSWGCIRMRSQDVIKVFDEIPVGTVVDIIPGKLPHLRRYQAPKVQPMAAPATMVAEKAPEQVKAEAVAGPSPASGKLAEEEKAAPAAKAAEIGQPENTAAAALPAIGEGPQEATESPWKALRGSFLLATVPMFGGEKVERKKTGAQ